MQLTLKQARNLKGLSLKDVSKTIGKTPQAISQWENGKVSISAQDFINLCDLYGQNYDNIILFNKSR